jgi:hypothetical protein
VKVKSAPARLKADGMDIDASGEFEAIVSVFGNVDSWGDVVQPGAFADSIDHWKTSANTLPVLWSHRMDDPTFNIGEVLDIAELEPGRQLPEWVDPHVTQHGGLWVKGRIDTGDDASPVAKQALRLMKARRVTQFSYAYDELESGWAKVDGREVWELRKLKLYEISPTQIGANELTELLAAKALGTKAGRALSQQNEDRIRQASDLLDEVLQSITSDDDGSDKAKSDGTQVPPLRTSPESSRLLGRAVRAAIALRFID